ncbi:MAG: DUF4040 domain-containing protein [bacterium]|nr:DUF4040 domain-containing protein [bacterium]
MVEFYCLLVFMVAAAIVACETRDLLGAIISFGAVGFVQAILFLMLQAPDLAITQVVVEVLTLVIFIAAISRATRVDTTAHPLATSIIGICILIFIVIVTIQVLRFLPKFGEPLLRVSNFYFENGLKGTGAANLVAAIILDFRGYDTLGEATVLFTACLGVIVILREIGKKKK